MKFSLVLSLAFACTSAYAVIYGENNIVEAEDIVERTFKQQSKAIAAVFNYFPEYGLQLERLGKSRKLAHKMVCEDELFYDQPIESVATAFLISENHIMTVGHAITSKDDCRKKNYFAFNYEWSKEKNGINPISREDIYFCKDIIAYSYTGIDYAIIELDRKVEGILPLELDFRHNSVNYEPIYTIGHPLQLPKKMATGHMRAQFPQDSNYYVAEIDTFRGNSGSPIFSALTNKVIGILKDGENDFELDEDRFCNMIKICPEDNVTCRGENITRLDKIPTNHLGMENHPAPQYKQ